MVFTFKRGQNRGIDSSPSEMNNIMRKFRFTSLLARICLIKECVISRVYNAYTEERILLSNKVAKRIA